MHVLSGTHPTVFLVRAPSPILGFCCHRRTEKSSRPRSGPAACDGHANAVGGGVAVVHGKFEDHHISIGVREASHPGVSRGTATVKIFCPVV